MIYPNLSELIKYHPYNIITFADFADVTLDLLEAALRGEEELNDEEIRKIARYTSVPFSVLKCPKKIMLDKNNHKHKRMVESLENALYEIWECWKNGSQEAETFMKYERSYVVNLELFFQDGRASYAQYIGTKEMIDQTKGFIRSEIMKHNKRGRTVKATA